MLSVGEFAVVVDSECCGGFEEGTCVEIGEIYEEAGQRFYACKSLSSELPRPNLICLQCPDCLHPIKDTDACQEVHNEH